MNSKRVVQKSLKKSQSEKSSSSQPTFLISEEYKEQVRNSSYLGKKGYTIPKSVLIKEDEAFLKTDLFVKPELNNAVQYNQLENQPFPVFRENEKKIYLNFMKKKIKVIL